MSKLIPGYKDNNGIFVKVPEQKPAPEEIDDFKDSTIDDLLKAGLQQIKGILRSTQADIGTGMPSRETIMNLKDAMTMLHELKKKEKEFLDSLSDDQLKELLKK